MLDIIETLKTLNANVSPSGRERDVSIAISKLAAPYADEVDVDRMGSLIVWKHGAPGGKRIMLSAHMDSIGVIVTYIEENGYLRFHNLGGLSVPNLIGVPVRFENGVCGVVNIEGGVKVADAALKNLFIDIGAKDRAEAEQMVAIADAAVYDTPTRKVGRGVASPYLDNRISCIVLLRALELLQGKECRNELAFVFSCQEEVGTRGAMTAAFGIEPDIGLAVDVTRTGDTPEATPKMACACGDGAAIKIMDGSLICSPRLVKALERCADAAGVRWQREVLQAGGTDAGSIQRSRAGVHAGCISIPTRYIHSPQEYCDLDDVEECAKLIAAFVSGDAEL